MICKPLIVDLSETFKQGMITGCAKNRGTLRLMSLGIWRRLTAFHFMPAKVEKWRPKELDIRLILAPRCNLSSGRFQGFPDIWFIGHLVRIERLYSRIQIGLQRVVRALQWQKCGVQIQRHDQHAPVVVFLKFRSQSNSTISPLFFLLLSGNNFPLFNQSSCVPLRATRWCLL
jgi:hypothetical protein